MLQRRSRAWIIAGFCAAAALAACGGGGVAPPPAALVTPAPNATFTAVPQAALAPFSVAATSVVPVPASTGDAAAPITIAVASTSDVVNEMDLSAAGAEVSDGTTVDTEATNGALSDAPAPTAARRFAEAGGVRTHIETVTVKFSKKVVLKTRPTFVFTFAAGFLVAANYYLQFFDTSQPGLGWQDPFEGPATVVGGATLLFVDTKNAFTFAAGVTYHFDLYAVSARSTPTPFPATPAPVASGPTPTPVPSPSVSPIFGFLTVTPASFAFTAAGQTQILNASEDGYNGAFTATVDDPSIASVTQPQRGTFVVTAANVAGSAHVVFTDGQGQKVSIPFTATITVGTISSKAHR